MTTESSSCSRPGSPTGPSRDTTSSPSDGIQPQNNTDKDNDQESPQVATGDSALNSSSSLPHGSPLIDPGHELHDCNSNGSTSSSDNEYIEPRKRICLAYSSSSSSLPINNTTPLSPTTNIITATTQNTFGPKLLRPEERCLSSSSSSCLSINHCQPNQSPHQEHNRNHHHNNNNHHSKHQSDKRYKSFLIDDILSQTFGKPKPKSLTGRPDPGRHSENKTRDSNNNSNNSNKNNSTKLTADCRIVRPWDISSNTSVNNNKRPNSVDEDTRSEKSTTDERSDVGSIGSPSNFGQNQSSPLDALFQLTQKAFESGSKINDSSGDNVMFNNRQTPKKKRKSRTAFTNHQIFELEKRFLYQKYLSPADRDELASSLSLTGAQVITWFQNRRAKLKRDMEELKKDMETAKMAHFQKGIYESIQDLSLLKSPEMRAALQLRKSP